MARTLTQIETDIQNNVTIKLMEYVKDYISQMANLNTDKLNALMQDIYAHVNGLDVVVGHIGKPHIPSKDPIQNPNPYDWYYNTDNHAFKMWDGSTWVEIATLSTTIDAYTRVESDNRYVKKTDLNTNINVAKYDKAVADLSQLRNSFGTLTTVEENVNPRYEKSYADAPNPEITSPPSTDLTINNIDVGAMDNSIAQMHFENADGSISFNLPVTLNTGATITEHKFILADGTTTDIEITVSLPLVGSPLHSINLHAPTPIFSDTSIKLLKIWTKKIPDYLSNYATQQYVNSQILANAPSTAEQAVLDANPFTDALKTKYDGYDTSKIGINSNRIGTSDSRADTLYFRKNNTTKLDAHTYIDNNNIYTGAYASEGTSDKHSYVLSKIKKETIGGAVKNIPYIVMKDPDGTAKEFSTSDLSKLKNLPDNTVLEISKKQDRLTAAQEAVINGTVFSPSDKTKLDGLPIPSESNTHIFYAPAGIDNDAIGGLLGTHERGPYRITTNTDIHNPQVISPTYKVTVIQQQNDGSVEMKIFAPRAMPFGINMMGSWQWEQNVGLGGGTTLTPGQSRAISDVINGVYATAASVLPKTDKSYVDGIKNNLQTSIDSKASISALNTLETKVNTKANASDLQSSVSSINTSLNSKVSSADLTNGLKTKMNKSLIQGVDFADFAALVSVQNEILKAGDFVNIMTVTYDNVVGVVLSKDSSILKIHGYRTVRATTGTSAHFGEISITPSTGSRLVIGGGLEIVKSDMTGVDDDALKRKLNDLGIHTTLFGAFQGVRPDNPPATSSYTPSELDWYISSVDGATHIYQTSDNDWHVVGGADSITKQQIINKLGISDAQLNNLKADHTQYLQQSSLNTYLNKNNADDSHRIADDTSSAATMVFRKGTVYKSQSYVDSNGAYVGAFNDGDTKHAVVKLGTMPGETAVKPILFGRDVDGDIYIDFRKIGDSIAQTTTNKNNISTNSNNISTNTNNISTERQRITTNADAIAVNKADIATNLRSINGNTTDIAAANNKINDNKSLITANANKILTNSNTLSTYVNSLAGERQRIDTNIAAIASIKNASDQNTANIYANLQKITVNTNNITDVNSRLDSTITTITANQTGLLNLANANKAAIEGKQDKLNYNQMSVVNGTVFSASDKSKLDTFGTTTASSNRLYWAPFGATNYDIGLALVRLVPVKGVPPKENWTPDITYKYTVIQQQADGSVTFKVFRPFARSAGGETAMTGWEFERELNLGGTDKATILGTIGLSASQLDTLNTTRLYTQAEKDKVANLPNNVWTSLATKQDTLDKAATLRLLGLSSLNSTQLLDASSDANSAVIKSANNMKVQAITSTTGAAFWVKDNRQSADDQYVGMTISGDTAHLAFKKHGATQESIPLDDILKIKGKNFVSATITFDDDSTRPFLMAEVNNG